MQERRCGDGHPICERSGEGCSPQLSGQGPGGELRHPPQQAEADHAHRSPRARQDRHHVADRRRAGHRLRWVHHHPPHPPVRHRAPHDRDQGVRRHGVSHHEVHHERDRGLRLRCHGVPGTYGGHPLHRRGQLRVGDPVGRNAGPAPEQEVRPPQDPGGLGSGRRRQPAGVQLLRQGVRHRHPGQD